MKRLYILLVVLVLLLLRASAQDVPLFSSHEPLRLRVTGSIKSIKKNSNDSTLITGKFDYRVDSSSWITVPVRARVRGNFRLRNCYFPPLKVKFKKKDVAATLFEGNKSLKLVMPCRTSKDKNLLIRKEYLCYQFYQVLSPYHFLTRLATMDLTEVSRKNPKPFTLLTFFVEDNSMVARRAQGKVVDTKGIPPASFDEKQSIRNDFFQYMIGNADWSAVMQHNSNTLFVQGKYVPLSYDFDMSGFVNADYAQQSPPTLGTGNPRERVYRGFCKSKSAMEDIRREFLAKESAVLAVIDQHQSAFSRYEHNDMRNYLGQFFTILKSDNLFKQSIVEGCRTK